MGLRFMLGVQNEINEFYNCCVTFNESARASLNKRVSKQRIFKVPCKSNKNLEFVFEFYLKHVNIFHFKQQEKECNTLGN